MGRQTSVDPVWGSHLGGLMMFRSTFCFVSLVVAPVAFASWTATLLDTPAGLDSIAGAVHGTMIVGAVTGGPYSAYRWTPSGVGTSLQPNGEYSLAFDTDGAKTYGLYRSSTPSNAPEEASMWSANGTRTSLAPFGASYSTIYGVGGGRQVGQTRFSGVPRATMWSGTSSSWTDLHPIGSIDSVAYDTDGTQQVGTSIIGTDQASLWTGSYTSFVNLNPANAQSSNAYTVSNGVQYGSAKFAGRARAGRWQGSAASWQDMHPAAAGTSEIFGSSGNVQVGYGDFISGYRPLVWRTGSSGYEDLMPYVPAGFSFAIADGVWTDGQVTRVVGRVGSSTPTVMRKAILWTHVVPEPSSALGCLLGFALLRSRGSRRGN